jgi:hypothetical protein
MLNADNNGIRAGQAENSIDAVFLTDGLPPLDRSGWWLEKVWPSRLWRIRYGDKLAVTLTTRQFVNGDVVWVKAFCLTHNPPFKLGYRQSYFAWQQKLLDECDEVLA